MNSDRLYSVLAEPHISEKASVVGEQSNQYAFKVASDATKHEIKRAVETIFKVSVKNVTTVNVKGKIKRTFRGMSRSRNWKKAYVRVADGQDIDFTEGAA